MYNNFGLFELEKAEYLCLREYFAMLVLQEQPSEVEK